MKKAIGFKGGRLLRVMTGLILSVGLAVLGQSAIASATAGNLPTQTLLAYNIDYGMDQARGEQTLEYYGDNKDFGDKLRDIIEQTLRNNVNHPNSKPTAENSYQRESALNDQLPESRSNAFSKDELSNLRKTQNPKDLLK